MRTRTCVLRAAGAWLCSAAAALAGCATAVDVRSVGTAVGLPPAYQLRGGSLAALHTQTRLLCPAGHQVLSQWQKLHRQPLAPQGLADWVAGHGTVRDAVGHVLDDGEAQMTVQCAVAAAAEPAAAPGPSSPRP